MKALLCVCALAGVAHAEVPASKPAAPAPPAPSSADEQAEEAADEANLESNAPRAGMTFTAAIGGGLTMGDGVGRGPAASFRLGHVATAASVLTLELTGGSLLHEMDKMPLLHNDFLSVMAGGLHYFNRSFWLRGAGGFTSYTIQPGNSKPDEPHRGAGVLVGAGIDLARWHYLVLGLETFGTFSVVSTRGLMFNSGLCLGLSYY